MFKLLSAVLLSSVLVSGTGLSGLHSAQEGVIKNPAFPNGQLGSNTLVYAVPADWQHDAKVEGTANFVGVLVPNGRTMTRTDRVITIEYVRKEPNTSGLENLTTYVREDLKQTISEKPNAQFARWQPSKLDPAKFFYWSMEVFAKEGNDPSPQHYLILDSGDGFYSVTLTVAHRSDLQQPVYDDFFNSLGLRAKS